MNALYIGIQTSGTTSQLRGESLKRILPHATWHEINTDAVFLNQPRWSRTLAYRLRTGPGVNAINQLIERQFDDTKTYDLIWIDKAVYLKPKTVRRLRSRAKHFIHYTPDTAFFANGSRFFEATIDLYDIVVTTKSFEVERYANRITRDRVALVTQSYDEQLHHVPCAFEEKRKEVVLIGLCEPDRERCVEQLLQRGVAVRIGGRQWNDFLSRHRHNPLLHFAGEAVFAGAYVDALGRASVGLGLLTKRFPELHTTRTFEIPACGTALATIRNCETEEFYRNEDVVFYDTYEELAIRVSELLNNSAELQAITDAGNRRVMEGDFSNEKVLKKILKRSNLL